MISQTGFPALSQNQTIKFANKMYKDWVLASAYEYAEIRWIKITIKKFLKFVNIFKDAKGKINKAIKRVQNTPVW